MLRAIRERALDVPRDIALVTFDDIEESTFGWPPSLLHSNPVRAMAAAAINRAA